MRPFLLKPATKDYIWGGTRLREEFGTESDAERIAESWVLSCHPDGESIIANGEYEGMTLSEFIRRHPEAVSPKFSSEDKFPILVKLIDAKKDLSLQVHPDDNYARIHENDSGKTECWYILDADKDAELICGFKEKLTKEQLRRAIEENNLMDKVWHVPVLKGDVFFIEPGTIHAIGKGILLAEIQQSSNVTYRVYDYGRLGADGKPRELHIEKALDVIKTNPKSPYRPLEIRKHYSHSVQHIAECKYFNSKRINLFGLNPSINGFVHGLFIDGEGTVEFDGGSFDVKKGSSVFFPNGMENCKIKGKCSVIMTTV